MFSKNEFAFVEQNFPKIFLFFLGLSLFILVTYLATNKHAVDQNNYTGDKNIEDNFVLPPQKDDKTLHSKDGNVISVINYFSLDCPYCRKLFFQEKKFVEKFGDKVNFLFRDKPLSSNKLSYEKALIKECVYINTGNSDQKYFEFTEEIFTKYEKNNGEKSNDWAKEIALGYIPKEKLDECLVNEELKQKIIGFRAKADASQIFWTPTIVVFKNGVEVERIEKVWGAMYEKVLEKYTR